MTNPLKNYYHADVLGKINHLIQAWELTSLQGKGLVARFNGGRSGYAHIELTISQGMEYTSEVIWNVNEHQIPFNFGHIPVVESALSFFSNYVSGIKGERVTLQFEITNIGIHIIDTQAKHFFEATMKALISCFDPDIFIFNSNLANRISGNSVEYSRQYKTSFLKSEILDSFKIKEISEILSKIFNEDNVDVRMLNGLHFNTYIDESFEIRKVLLNENDMNILRTNNAINDRITDIGKANIAKILHDFYDLRYHFNILREDLV